MILQPIFVIYGILCILIGLLKPPFIWNMKKFEVMAKMFGGDKGLQIFVLAWGLAAVLIGLLVF